MSKHTPGPWNVTWENRPPGEYYIPECARNEEFGDVTGDGDMVSDANARLIAAAPEMLEALEKIFAELEKDARRLANSNRRGDQSVGYTLGACRQWAHEAIAKAKGGAR